MYGCESWTVKKAECRRIDAFELWCWRRLLRVPWTARRSIQSILKEISPGISLEGMMLKLKLQYFGHLIGRVDSMEKTLMLGGIGGRRRRGRRGWDGWMASQTRLTWVWMNSERWWWTGRPGVLQFMGSQIVGHHWATELTELMDHLKVKVAELCPTLCDPMDYTVNGILQARILEWVTFPFFRWSSRPRNRTRVSCTAGGFFTNWAIREAQQIKKLSGFFFLIKYSFWDSLNKWIISRDSNALRYSINLGQLAF